MHKNLPRRQVRKKSGPNSVRLSLIKTCSGKVLIALSKLRTRKCILESFLKLIMTIAMKISYNSCSWQENHSRNKSLTLSSFLHTPNAEKNVSLNLKTLSGSQIRLICKRSVTNASMPKCMKLLKSSSLN